MIADAAGASDEMVFFFFVCDYAVLLLGRLRIRSSVAFSTLLIDCITIKKRGISDLPINFLLVYSFLSQYSKTSIFKSQLESVCFSNCRLPPA
jgi:hypothetical protein